MESLDLSHINVTHSVSVGKHKGLVGIKIFLDALVKSGRLKNDGFKNVFGFCDSFFIDRGNVRIEIDIHENMDGD